MTMETPDKATPRDIAWSLVPKSIPQGIREEIVDSIEKELASRSREAEIQRLKDDSEKFRIQILDAFEKQRERYEAEIKGKDAEIGRLKAVVEENRFRIEKMMESNQYKDIVIARLRLSSEELRSRCQSMEEKHGMALSNMDFDGWAQVGNAVVDIEEALRVLKDIDQNNALTPAPEEA